MKRDPAAAILAVMVISLVLVFGFNLTRRAPSPGAGAAARIQGKAAPNFTLQSLDGNAVRLSDFHDKAVLLNFWETSCEPCRIETPWFVELQKQYGPQGLQIVGIVMDEGTDAEDIANYAKEMGINYPILVGKESVRVVANDYGGIPFFPETFYISRDGRLIGESIGLKSKSRIEDEIKKMLLSQREPA
jgi:peroxiredoxin